MGCCKKTTVDVAVNQVELMGLLSDLLKLVSELKEIKEFGFNKETIRFAVKLLKVFAEITDSKVDDDLVSLLEGVANDDALMDALIKLVDLVRGVNKPDKKHDEDDEIAVKKVW